MLKEINRLYEMVSLLGQSESETKCLNDFTVRLQNAALDYAQYCGTTIISAGIRQRMVNTQARFKIPAVSSAAPKPADQDAAPKSTSQDAAPEPAGQDAAPELAGRDAASKPAGQDAAPVSASTKRKREEDPEDSLKEPPAKK